MNDILKMTERFRKYDEAAAGTGEEHEFCPRCNADLTFQKDYSNLLPYWICKGCGEMLINPEVESESDVAWICDGCGRMLNIQPGFREDCGTWTCRECGFENRIDVSELYDSEDEYEASLKDPYKGLSDEEVLALSMYEELDTIGGRGHIHLIRDRETGKPYIKKVLTVYEKSVYEFFIQHPVRHMPGIIALYEGSNCLIVIEEYIAGLTIAERLQQGVFPPEQAAGIVRKVCMILDELHSLPVPVVHRDVKPSNIILTPEGEVYLLDINVAKWYDPEKSTDTRYMGTREYAAPEQAGYGLKASSAKADIYAAGMLLNVMCTGTFPKEKRAEGDLWKVIERCICLDAGERYTAKELMGELERLEQKKG
ncbi:MAG: protein kinase [Lachnospiraceae bacterium]|nr:protein kinase [Lachnospiraceae bacterium]